MQRLSSKRVCQIIDNISLYGQIEIHTQVLPVNPSPSLVPRPRPLPVCNCELNTSLKQYLRFSYWYWEQRIKFNYLVDTFLCVASRMVGWPLLIKTAGVNHLLQLGAAVVCSLQWEGGTHAYIYIYMLIAPRACPAEYIHEPLYNNKLQISSNTVNRIEECNGGDLRTRLGILV